MRPFVKAVMTGTALGASPFMLITLPLGVGEALSDLSVAGILHALIIIFFPLFWSFIIVLLCSLFLGVPVFLLLKKYDRETMENYVIIGALLGIVVPGAFIFLARAHSGYELCVVGAVAGAVTSWSWARLRLREKNKGRRNFGAS
jgi:hypothetical protein